MKHAPVGGYGGVPRSPVAARELRPRQAWALEECLASESLHDRKGVRRMPWRQGVGEERARRCCAQAAGGPGARAEGERGVKPVMPSMHRVRLERNGWRG